MRKDRSWLTNRNADPFKKKASALNYRSRSVFKLQELNSLAHFIEKSNVIVDVGSAPGGWSQYVTDCKRLCEQQYKLITLDVRPMQSIVRAEFVHGNFELEAVQQQVASKLSGRRADLILSDACPDISGVGESDRFNLLTTAKSLLKFSEAFLKKEGTVLLKTFSEISEMVRKMYSCRFIKVRTYKPCASRFQSSEVFMLCSGRVVDGNRTHGSRSHNPELYH